MKKKVGKSIFYELTITGDSGYGILEEEHENKYLNDIVLVKFTKAIWKGKLIQITFSDRKDDSEFLKAKFIDTRKEANYYKNVSLDYSKK